MTARASLPRSRAPRRRRRRGGALRDWLRAARLLGLILVAALALRCLVVMPRAIPSESMRPGLVPGDYVLVEKWPYGWSRYSLPVVPPWPHGRLLARAPARGDVVVFRAPGGRDFIKRVIGLPGDTVAMAGGRLILNGRMVPRRRIADAVAPAARGCRSIAPPPYGAAAGRCRLPAFAETLPGGRGYTIIDQGATMQDDMAPARVPPGHYFMLGDNRDLSEDSRFPVEAGGIGMVPAEDLEGRAGAVAFSIGRGLGGVLPRAAR